MIMIAVKLNMRENYFKCIKRKKIIDKKKQNKECLQLKKK